MESSILTPMIVQYLVGLCCYHREPDAVEVILGDMVHDEAAEEERDVDVTVTLKDAEGVGTLKAFEVKREKRPLSVTTIEQLIAKLRDMPAVTHRAIVSTSGFTKGAVTKAKKYDTQLYEMKPWTRPIGEHFESFIGFKGPEDFFARFNSNFLYWMGATFFLTVPDGPPSFSIKPDDPIFDEHGTLHAKFKNYAELKDQMSLQSTIVLFNMEPARTINRIFPLQSHNGIPGVMFGPMLPHTHTLDTSGQGIYLRFEEKLCKVSLVSITGSLQWQRQRKIPEFLIMEENGSSKAFAGAVITAMGGPEDIMLALTLSPENREVRFREIKLEEKHKNMIRKLRIK